MEGKEAALSHHLTPINMHNQHKKNILLRMLG